ncbi:hypothetical protein ACFV7Q_31630 [Streptomyces sp. NPDC059851]|uniref:hypothetical protein n=1 Tax=Streptomyces sp. NPDC059851 TaxID=3346971 RepID=UPI0036693D40
MTPCIHGAKVRTVRDKQLLGQQLVERGADPGRIGLEEAPDLYEIVRRLRGGGGDGGAQAICCRNQMPT